MKIAGVMRVSFFLVEKSFLDDGGIHLRTLMSPSQSVRSSSGTLGTKRQVRVSPRVGPQHLEPSEQFIDAYSSITHIHCRGRPRPESLATGRRDITTTIYDHLNFDFMILNTSWICIICLCFVVVDYQHHHLKMSDRVFALSEWHRH